MPQNIAPPGLISLLAAALAQQPTKPLVLALDGRCGSGKTTLANTLARQFPASITLHTDDFYLPPAQRIRGWEKTPCANMDLARLRDEALRPAYEGQPVQYRAYSCREGAYLPARELAAQPLVILEGSYSHHPLLTGCETLRVFLTCAKEEQTRRLQAREKLATGRLARTDTSAVAMVIPAEGPSFGIAPSGMCRWMSVLVKASSSMPSSLARDLANEYAA